jgi:hypothetical protein
MAAPKLRVLYSKNDSDSREIMCLLLANEDFEVIGPDITANRSSDRSAVRRFSRRHSIHSLNTSARTRPLAEASRHLVGPFVELDLGA